MGKILFYCAPDHRHMNVCMSIAKEIHYQKPGVHQTVFAANELWQTLLPNENPAFEIACYKDPPPEPLVSGAEPMTAMDNLMELLERFPKCGTEERNRIYAQSLFIMIDYHQSIAPQLEEIVKIQKPDLILIDNIAFMPHMTNKGIPWSHIFSVNPTAIGLETLPPFLVQAKFSEPDTWPAKWQEYTEIFYKIIKTHNYWIRSSAIPRLRKNRWNGESPYLNIYMYPREINYENAFDHLGDHWYQIDSAISPHEEVIELELDGTFLQMPGNLLYFSMGSFLSMNLPFMKRMLTLLSQLPFKFLVCAGPRWSELNIPKNCLAMPFLNQKAALRKVEAVITHGGNNTLTECFHFGCPIILCPVYADQIDNAIRLLECGFIEQWLDPFTCTQGDLNFVIVRALYNQEVKQKMKKASERMKKDNGFLKAVNAVIKFIEH